MENFYKVILNPKKENLHGHAIHYFDKIFDSFPDDAEKIILFINDCYNYKSPYIIDGKDWRKFLEERLKMNNVSLELREKILKNEFPEVVEGIWEYIYAQKQSLWELKMIKENLRTQMMDTLRKDVNIGEKKSANEMLTSLQDEIEKIDERIIQDNQVFGKGSGFDAIKKARSVTQLNIVNVD